MGRPWSQRNDYRSRSRQPSAVTLTARLRSRLHFSSLLCLGVSALCAGAAGLRDSGGLTMLSALWRVTPSGSSCKLLFTLLAYFNLLVCLVARRILLCFFHSYRVGPRLARIWFSRRHVWCCAFLLGQYLSLVR